MLTLAQELGVEDLQNTCEEHITSTMSVLNACTFLAAAMDIQDRASSKYTLIALNLRFIPKCIENSRKYMFCTQAERAPSRSSTGAFRSSAKTQRNA